MSGFEKEFLLTDSRELLQKRGAASMMVGTEGLLKKQKLVQNLSKATTKVMALHTGLSQ